jgi:L-ascorbate metabolism protein UlaG (beta-lactamase superfamily)
MNRIIRDLSLCAAWCAASAVHAADHVDITWMSITNMYLDFGKTRVLADGYITRLPRDVFYSGQSGYGKTQRAVKPDVAAVKEVMDALGGPSAVNLLLTGHNHFDHSFDTGTWAKLSGARIIGAPTACLQVRAQGIPRARCTAVYGGESFEPEPGVHVYVIRWNHSGGPALNPELHEPRELSAVPRPDAGGALRAGVTEDCPNGGGNRAYLFVVDTAGGPLSIFFHDSASPVDLTTPIVMNGHDYGAPLRNLERALADAHLAGVDLWIGTGGRDVAALLLPVLKPRAHIPVHWDGLFGAFKAGTEQPFSDPALEKLLTDSGVRLVAPVQYMDKWRLDRTGLQPVDNTTVKQKLGFQR